jgi:GT2 family glycosyltransferase
VGHADIAGVDVRIVGEDGHTHPTDGEPDYASGGWCAIAGRVFRSGVRFDPAFFPNYWEDVDIGFQARAGGFRIARAHNVGLKHDDHPANMAHYERTRSLFAQKWGQTWRE